MKVMVVDEEETICKRLQAELQKEGYDVEYTTQPVGVVEKLSEAKKKGKDYAFELLLLDLRMPEINGLTLLNMSFGYLHFMTNLNETIDNHMSN